MNKPIVTDVIFLRQKADITTENDTNVIRDLEDTLAANRERCVGMA